LNSEAKFAVEQGLLLEISALCVRAGRAILDIYNQGENAAGIRTKNDSSPVTDADERAEEILLEGLAQLMPGVPVLAEESAARGIIPDLSEYFLLVDPLDGTREFISRNGEFTVNVGLVMSGKPVAGCVYAPALGTSWIGRAGGGASIARNVVGGPGDEWQTIHARRPHSEGLIAVASRSHSDEQTDRFLSGLRVAERISAGSSLKFCLVAEGAADVYPRFGRTMEWDTAAGHAVLAAAGGSVVTPEGLPFLYGKHEQGYANGPFVAWGASR
jgi:3'(2'), 5'-bisphosphate nucleotidase